MASERLIENPHATQFLRLIPTTNTQCSKGDAATAVGIFTRRPWSRRLNQILPDVPRFDTVLGSRKMAEQLSSAEVGRKQIAPAT